MNVGKAPAQQSLVPDAAKDGLEPQAVDELKRRLKPKVGLHDTHEIAGPSSLPFLAVTLGSPKNGVSR